MQPECWQNVLSVFLLMSLTDVYSTR